MEVNMPRTKMKIKVAPDAKKNMTPHTSSEVERALTESQNMLEMVINNVPQHIFWKNTNSVFIGCNKNFAKAVGLNKPDDIKGKTDFDLSNADDAKHFIETDKQVISQNEPIVNLIERYNGNNGEVWISINKIPLLNEKGVVIGLLGTFEDITERKKMELKIHKSEEKYRSLIEFTNTAFIILDTKLRIIETNATFMNLVELPSETFILNSSLRSWVVGKDIDKFDESFKQVLNGKILDDMEINLINENGPNVYVGISANIIENGEKRIFCLLRDKSFKKEAMSQQYIRKQKKKDKLIQKLTEIRNELKNK